MFKAYLENVPLQFHSILAQSVTLNEINQCNIAANLCLGLFNLTCHKSAVDKTKLRQHWYLFVEPLSTNIKIKKVLLEGNTSGGSEGGGGGRGMLRKKRIRFSNRENLVSII